VRRLTCTASYHLEFKMYKEGSRKGIERGVFMPVELRRNLNWQMDV